MEVDAPIIKLVPFFALFAYAVIKKCKIFFLQVLKVIPLLII